MKTLWLGCCRVLAFAFGVCDRRDRRGRTLGNLSNSELDRRLG